MIKKIFSYLSVLILMLVTLGYQNCSRRQIEGTKQGKASVTPLPASLDTYIGVLSSTQANIRIISAKVRTDSSQVRVFGVCDLPEGKKGEISGEIIKTSCSDCQPFSWSSECEDGQFQFSGTLSDQLSVTSQDDDYTALVVMSVIDNVTQNKESSVSHSLTASIENYVPGGGGNGNGGGGNTIPDRFVLSVNDACSYETSWTKPTENCRESTSHGGSTACSSGYVSTMPWKKDLDHGGQATCRTTHKLDNYHNDNNESLSKSQYVYSRVYIYCPSGYSTSYVETKCIETKTSNNSKPLDVSVSSCSVTCTKDNEESKPTPPDSFTLSVNRTCSKTTSWVKPTENCEQSSLHGGSTKCSEQVYEYPWREDLDYGGKAVCQTSHTVDNYHNDDESLSKRQSGASTIYLYCPIGYDVSSYSCRDTKTNEDESTMSVSVSSCAATCTKKEEEGD